MSRRSEVDFEHDFETGGAETAARNLINPNLEFEIVKPDGHFSVEVRSPSLKVLGQGVSHDYTIGILVAWVNFVHGLVQVSSQDSPSDLIDLRKSQSAQHPKSTRH